MRFINPSLLGLVLLVSACGGNDNQPTTNTDKTGGSSNAGGSSATGGKATAGGNSGVGGAGQVGGTSATQGGASATGGTSNVVGTATGGVSNGGSLTTGGTTAAGTGNTGGTQTAGASNTGGSSTPGGSSTGGSSTTGGSKPTGGTSSVAGTVSTGGSSTSGGASTIGGRSGTGGVTTNGGTAQTGGTTPSTGGSATGGSSSGSGGTSATGGSAGVITGGATAAGGGGGTGAVASWTCAASHYSAHDGCDCGCGAYDPDCNEVVQNPPNSLCSGDGHSADCCTTYTLQGSCAPQKNGFPYYAILPTDNAHCAFAPPGWTCGYSFYSDGGCDCGCGAFDNVDCAGDRSTAACFIATELAACSEVSDIKALQPDNNAVCLATFPAGWKCDMDLYNDGKCDCGCGIPDPECVSAGSGSCVECNDPGSCAVQTTLGCSAISDTDNSKCKTTLWTCDVAIPGDGYCDCGCGSIDPDCTSPNSVSECANCGYPGSCASTCDQIDPTNIGTCKTQ